MSAVDWVNAVGTSVGAVATTSAAAIALGIAVRDGRERDAARRDDEAAQARTLTVETLDKYGDELAVVRITNHGTQPMLAVYLERIVISPDDAGPGARQTIEGRGCAVLAPGGAYEAVVEVTTPEGKPFRLEKPYLASGVVRYHDASGRAWRRWGNTDPRRIIRAADTDRLPPDQGHKVTEVSR